MARLETSVSTPVGIIITLPGRVPRNEAVKQARDILMRRLNEVSDQIEKFNAGEFVVQSHRGNLEVKTYEELTDGKVNLGR